MKPEDDPNFGGYASKMLIPGTNKVVYFKCAVVEVYPMTCPKCGGSMELKYGHGKCEFCGTNYSTEFKLSEVE